jgi:hypothetical protein
MLGKALASPKSLYYIHRTNETQPHGFWDGHPMTSKADRRAISRAVAKAIAYHDCGKPEKAAAWAVEVVRLLEAQTILTPAALTSQPE